MLIPYRADLELKRAPIITIAVCLICLAVYLLQQNSFQEAVGRSLHFCSTYNSAQEQMLFTSALGTADQAACMQLVMALRDAEQPAVILDELVANSTPLTGYSAEESKILVRGFFARLESDYRIAAPVSTTENLWYEPESWDPVQMILSAFAHGSWGHVIGNLFFWFAFAAAVEAIIGPRAFVGVIVAIALGAGVLYSLSTLGMENPPPTLGLSGVVSGMMALLLFFLPQARICFLFFLVVIFKRFTVPVWLVVFVFIGWDAYTLFFGGGREGVNLVAHVGGAAVGLALGFVFFRKQREEVQAFAQEGI